MNYRHSFHAGGFADCMKHCLLVWLIGALQRKPAPIFVLDTHAGPGRYDLGSGPARRTGEWRGGIGQLLDQPPACLATYIDLVCTLGLYPGSPALIRAMLRDKDSLACCELNPEDAIQLRRLFARDRRVAVHHRNAWEALGALLPPNDRRGLILVDPPYESRQEFADLAAGLAKGYRRFRSGVFAAWYPIKHRAPVREFYARLLDTDVRDLIAVELCLREPVDAAQLNGCGMLIINPPYRIEEEATPILEVLLQRLGRREPGAGVAFRRLA